METLSVGMMTAIMNALDRGDNVFGDLSPDVRARLFAVAEEVTQETWSNAYSCMISNGRFLTLWQACIRHAGYDVVSRPEGRPWPKLPTREQIHTALFEGTRG